MRQYIHTLRVPYRIVSGWEADTLCCTVECLISQTVARVKINMLLWEAGMAINCYFNMREVRRQ